MRYSSSMLVHVPTPFHSWLLQDYRLQTWSHHLNILRKQQTVCRLTMWQLPLWFQPTQIFHPVPRCPFGRPQPTLRWLPLWWTVRRYAPSLTWIGWALILPTAKSSLRWSAGSHAWITMELNVKPAIVTPNFFPVLPIGLVTVGTKNFVHTFC